MTDRMWIVIALGFAISFTLTPLLRNAARQRGLLDVPNEASSHTVPTPRNGGFAIFASIMAAFAFALSGPLIVRLLVMTVITGMLPAIDEFRPLPRTLRLVIQAVMAVATVLVLDLGPRSILLPVAGTIHLGSLGIVLAIVWLVGVVNTYNFMDGLNGLASGAAVVCGVALGVLFIRHHDPAAAFIAFGLAAAAAGFVPWNVPSGSVFMGDVGSATLGFLLCVLSLRLVQDGAAVLVACLPVASFCSDGFVTIIRRAAKGERFFATRHRSHYYQWLNQQGWSHTAVSALWCLLVATASLAALAYEALPQVGRVSAFGAVVAVHATVFLWIAARQKVLR